MVKPKLVCEQCGSTRIGIKAVIIARGGLYPTTHITKTECDVVAVCRCCAEKVELSQTTIDKFLKVAMKGTHIENKS